MADAVWRSGHVAALAAPSKRCCFRGLLQLQQKSPMPHEHIAPSAASHACRFHGAGLVGCLSNTSCTPEPEFKLPVVEQSRLGAHLEGLLHPFGEGSVHRLRAHGARSARFHDWVETICCAPFPMASLYSICSTSSCLRPEKPKQSQQTPAKEGIRIMSIR